MDVYKAHRVGQLRVVRSESYPRSRPQPERDAPASTESKVEISRSASLLGTLSALQQSDRREFGYVMGEVASNLRAAANPESGTVGAELSQLADRLKRAGKTGDLSSVAASVVPTQGGLAQATVSRAMQAYARNAPEPKASSTVEQALDYVAAVVKGRTPATAL